MTFLFPILQLHIGDGIEAVHAIGRTAGVPVSEPSIAELSDNLAASHISGNSKPAKDQMLHVLIIDADAGDSRYAFGPAKSFNGGNTYSVMLTSVRA